ncbi:hypothetical protein [Streptomyces sp. MS1.AVA.4]|uniref:Uncharacterized protein n=1 Tax=Streptomyces pratisoli TaxID=3139917 RepID=A0ACC6QUZ5_9ACTN
MSLTVWPARTVLPATQQHHRQVVNLVNGASAPVNIEVEPSQFTQAASGEITFRPPGPVSAASWVSVTPTRFRLKARETRKVTVDVSVPDRPEPGERYIAILFKTPPRKTSRNVQVVGAVASQFLINVPGKAVHRILADRLEAPRFAFGGPLDLSLSIRNAGNVHRSYTGPNRITATAGGKKLVFPHITILGNSRRTVTAQWPDPPLFCVCRASVTFPTGKGEHITRTARIVIVPLPQIIGLLAAALGLFLLTRKGVRYQRALLTAARQEHR